ncbi:tbc domain protein [Grosmannia clavigera kw1407]|uniref:Tbc domain protein n=1 Tax=Grosmannia clavigera (strain kw1407 / UAMH 11150) TaxID=655863 RepID=F0XQY9_GROCL|nr:tbc domain protein [Grosmannia clavigera kw1407]EFW99810.1 tbc domain protein [Grosmannia clavigera kw1407]
MIYEQAVDFTAPSPGSPPGMTASKSSKSSSFHSISSDDNSVLSDVNHFEDIGLDDDTIPRHDRDNIKSQPNRFSPSFSADLRVASLQQKGPHTHAHMSRDLANIRRPNASPNSRPSYPSLQTQVRSVNVRSTHTNTLLPEASSARSLSRSSSLSFRHRSPSPRVHSTPGLKNPSLPAKLRRSSWQPTRERKTSLELELECDEDEGDDIPDGLVLDNVPISPRPPSERSRPVSSASSKTGSPDRGSKDKRKSVGNGTPPVAIAQGSLRSPAWRSEALKSPGEMPGPVKMRAKSWTAALSELSLEAKVLTEKLEEHADELQQKAQRSSTGSMPVVRRIVTDPVNNKPRHNSAHPELPPLRRSNIMIDPLPVSKEKEAVLSRTRPSWLPPKDPAEERRHLKEYQKMMAHSAEAERRREADRRARSDCRDTAAKGLMQIWEQDIIPRWSEAVRERRTRELWWRGVAPRSRGGVWARAIGNELGLTEMSFQAALGRASEVEARIKAQTGTPDDERYASHFAAIRRDVEHSTWKDLKIFQAGAPLNLGLMDVLMAYSMYRSDIGYVSGCNTIAALLLLNLPGPASAFVALANVLNRPLPLSFYAADSGAKSSAYNLLLQTLLAKSPALYYHITSFPDHEPDYCFGSLFTSLFTNCLALDEAARLWDVYVFEGDAILVHAGVAYVMGKEMELLGAKNQEEIRSILHRYEDGHGGRRAVVAQSGEEDRWMKSVRAVGKA